MKISIFKHTPKPLTKFLAYKRNETYKLADTKGNIAGVMKASRQLVTYEEYYPKITDYFSFYIKLLFIEPKMRGKGAGTAMLNIAAKESYRNMCDGKVHLLAGRLGKNEPLPQIFYRKYGFTTQYKDHLKQIDNAIKNNTTDMKFKSCTPMYLPLRFQSHR